jgi:hypothetical protein
VRFHPGCAATYTENITINFSLKICRLGASTTIIDGGGVATVVTIPGNSNRKVNIALSKLTIRNGFGPYGGGIYDGAEALTINRYVIEENSSGGLEAASCSLDTTEGGRCGASCGAVDNAAQNPSHNGPRNILNLLGRSTHAFDAHNHIFL